MRDYATGILGVASGFGSALSWILANLGIISTLAGGVGSVFGACVAFAVWQERRTRLRHALRLEQQELADIAAGRRINPKSWS